LKTLWKVRRLWSVYTNNVFQSVGCDSRIQR
jgi:hypothetical protein